MFHCHTSQGYTLSYLYRPCDPCSEQCFCLLTRDAHCQGEFSTSQGKTGRPTLIKGWVALSSRVGLIT